MAKKRAARGQQGRMEKSKIGPKAVKKKVFSKPSDSPHFPKKFKKREGPKGVSERKAKEKSMLAKLLRIENDVWKKNTSMDSTKMGQRYQCTTSKVRVQSFFLTSKRRKVGVISNNKGSISFGE
jgi:hypothetical protein